MVKGGLVLLVLAILIAGVVVVSYRAATNPCRCTKRKCWTTHGTSFPDDEGRVYPTTSVECRCLEQWCPAEKCP